MDTAQHKRNLRPTATRELKICTRTPVPLNFCVSCARSEQANYNYSHSDSGELYLSVSQVGFAQVNRLLVNPLGPEQQHHW